MRRVLLAIITGLLAGGLLAGPAAANNDPHRFFLPSGSFDLAAAPDGPCAFAVHVETLVNREYMSATQLADGSWRYVYTGTLKLRLSANGKTLDLNTSGPGVDIYAPDGSNSVTLEGNNLIYNPTLPAWGFPSALVYTSGLVSLTAAPADNWATLAVTGVSRMPRAVMDVCAALAS